MEARSFESIHDDYGFFLQHSTEPQRCRAAMLEEIRRWHPERTRVRLLDFGCSRGEFLAGLLADWAPDPATLWVSATDIDASALPAARERLRPFTDMEVGTSTGLEDVEAPFDIILSNHVLYYVPDLTGTLETLRGALAEEGLMLLLLGGRGNGLTGFWDAAYGSDAPPWNRAEEVESALRSMGVAFRRAEVVSQLAFPDSDENRTRILRFLFADSLARFDVGRLLGHFDRHRADGEILIENRDVLFAIGG